MSSDLIPNFRQGTGSEYLGQAFLNYLGTAILVSRQEDIGFDHICHRLLADPPSFGLPFFVQTKSSANDFDWDNDLKIRLLFSHERMPLFVAVVDRSDQDKTPFFSLYWTGDFWLGRSSVLDRESQVKRVRFVFGQAPHDSRFEDKSGRLSVYLGDPVLTLDGAVFQKDPFVPDPGQCRKLDMAILADWENLQHEAKKLPYFLYRLTPNGSAGFTYQYAELDESGFQRMLDFQRPFFNSIACYFCSSKTRHLDPDLASKFAAFLACLNEKKLVTFSEEDRKILFPLWTFLNDKSSVMQTSLGTPPGPTGPLGLDAPSSIPSVWSAGGPPGPLGPRMP